jgi:hypothetical protein
MLIHNSPKKSQKCKISVSAQISEKQPSPMGTYKGRKIDGAKTVLNECFDVKRAEKNKLSRVMFSDLAIFRRLSHRHTVQEH